MTNKSKNESKSIIQNAGKGQTNTELLTSCIIVTAILISLLFGVVEAATITHQTTANGTNYFKYEGTVRFEDEFKLNELIKKHPKTKWIVLESDGGYVSASFAVGLVIREAKLNTAIDKNGSCASACNYIFLGGVKRVMHDEALSLWHPSWSSAFDGRSTLNEIDLKSQKHAMEIAHYVSLMVAEGMEYKAIKFLSTKVWTGEWNRSKLYRAPKQTLVDAGIVTQ